MLHRALLLALLPTAAVFAAEPALDHAIALHTAGKLPEALREYRALARSSDPVVAATALSNACVIQNDLGEYKAALPDCRRALEVCRTLGDPGTLARAPCRPPPGSSRRWGISWVEGRRCSLAARRPKAPSARRPDEGRGWSIWRPIP